MIQRLPALAELVEAETLDPAAVGEFLALAEGDLAALRAGTSRAAPSELPRGKLDEICSAAVTHIARIRSRLGGGAG